MNTPIPINSHIHTTHFPSVSKKNTKIQTLKSRLANLTPTFRFSLENNVFTIISRDDGLYGIILLCRRCWRQRWLRDPSTFGAYSTHETWTWKLLYKTTRVFRYAGNYESTVQSDPVKLFPPSPVTPVALSIVIVLYDDGQSFQVWKMNKCKVKIRCCPWSIAGWFGARATLNRGEEKVLARNFKSPPVISVCTVERGALEKGRRKMCKIQAMRRALLRLSK